MSTDVKIKALPQTEPGELNKFRLAVLSISHLVGDMYVSILNPLWPLLITKLQLSLTSVGAFTSIIGLLLLPVQPATGWLVDRFSRGWFMMLGLTGAAVFMSLVGLVPTYSLLIVFVLVGRFANSIFHPHAAIMVRTTGEGRQGTAMSIFAFAGNIGVALGPLLIVVIVTAFGLEASYLMMPVGLLAAWAVYHYVGTSIPQGAYSDVSTAASQGGMERFDEPRTALRPLVLLTGLMILRAAIWVGVRTFLPVYLVDYQGASLLMGGLGLSVLSLFGAFGGLLGGYLSDRFARSRVIALSFLFAAVGTFMFLQMDGTLSLLALVIAGMAMYASQPVSTVLAQELAPGRMALASGVMMGMVWNIGSLILTPVGMLADAAGVVAALNALAGLAAVAGLIAFFLPETARTR